MVESFYIFSKRCALFLYRSSFLRCDMGVTAIEYALIATLVAVAIVTALTSVGSGVLNLFTTVANALP